MVDLVRRGGNKIMGEELNNNKIYFKCVEDEEFKEISGATEIFLDNDEIQELVKPSQTFSFNVDKNVVKQLEKTLKINTISAKRFKKLLMANGFSKKEAENINNIYVKNKIPRTLPRIKKN